MTATPAGRRLIGAALRRYREAQGYSLLDAARILECDRSKISRIETGQRGIRPRELRDLLTEYDTGSSESAVLLTLARLRRAHGWWHSYHDILDDDLLDYLAMETAAARILTYDPQQVPALLQAPGYARAIAATGSTLTGPDAHDRAVEMTLTRQNVILGADQPQIVAVISEGALRQQVGGPATMHDQLTHLHTLASGNPQITVRILPFTTGAHPAIGTGGLTILQFAGTPGIGLIQFPSITGGSYVEDARDVARHTAAFYRLSETALSPPDTAAALHRMAAGLHLVR